MNFDRLFVKLSSTATICLGIAASLYAAPPRLTVVVVVDQMRADYPQRFSREYVGGFVRLNQEGAVFTKARHGHVPTETAPGHTALLTGCFPSQHGIVSNDWWDRATQQEIYSVDDPEYGRSPMREMCPTLGELLKTASPHSKVVSISGKDRAAILMAGHKPDLVLWYDAGAGQFISSGYYGRLPDWVWQWDSQLRIPFDQRKNVPVTPLLDSMTLELAKKAIEKENLGSHEALDLLTISLSVTDTLGHKLGPDSLEMHNQLLALDRELAFFFDFLDRRIGRGNYTLAFSSDHGVLPVPEEEAGKQMHATRIFEEDLLAEIESGLNKRFGTPPDGKKWAVNINLPNLFLNMPLVMEKGIDGRAFIQEVAAILKKNPSVAQVFFPEDLGPNGHASGPYAETYKLSFNKERSGDLLLRLREGVLMDYKNSGLATSHGTPYDYDAHIPLILMGNGIKPGRYDRDSLAEDLTPTLARILGLSIQPKGPSRVLDEALLTQPQTRVSTPASRPQPKTLPASSTAR